MVQYYREKEPVLEVSFYETAAGVEPVRVWLRSLDQKSRNLIGKSLMEVQYDWPVGMPLVRHLVGPIWEVRTSLTKRRVRLLFALIGERMLVLYCFIKKSQKTPRKEIDLALTRYNDAIRRLESDKE